ncbi:hypothetical protein U1Q18_039877 [Sarracenia purpurea var. burkii]
MAEPQRIYPVHDPEAPPQTPTVPLVPRGSSKSDNVNPAAREEHPVAPPLYHPPLPAAHSKPPKTRSCWCKCLCWTISLLLIQILVVGIIAAIVYFVFQPKIPKYSLDSLRITNFTLNNDNSLYATFNVNITIRNPNKKIGIYYENGSQLSVWYTGTQLSEGSLPKFYQGHRNTTVLDVALTGQTQNATGLLQTLRSQQEMTGAVPLRMNGKVPVRLKLGSLKLMKWKFLVRCNLEVNSLAADNVISIRSSRCKFRFRL